MLKLLHLLLILLLFNVLVSFTSIAAAHVLEKDGSIGVVIHITPDDDPIAGELSKFFFEFKDTTGKFKPSECDCIVTILQSDKQIYQQSLFQNNTDVNVQNTSFSFTFPQKKCLHHQN